MSRGERFFASQAEGAVKYLGQEKQEQVLELYAFRRTLAAMYPERDHFTVRLGSPNFHIYPHQEIFTNSDEPMSLVEAVHYLGSFIPKNQKKEPRTVYFLLHALQRQGSIPESDFPAIISQTQDSRPSPEEFDEVIRKDFVKMVDYNLNWATRKARRGNNEYHYYKDWAMEVSSLAGINEDQMGQRVAQVDKIYTQGVIERLAKKITSFKAGDDIIRVVHDFYWQAIFPAQDNGSEVDFAEELSPMLFFQFDKYFREYVTSAKPKDRVQFDANISFRLLGMFEALQYCKDDITMQSFWDLVAFVKTKQSPAGAATTDYYIAKGADVLAQREDIRLAIKEKNEKKGKETPSLEPV